MNCPSGKQDDLHGSAPDNHGTAFLLIDVYVNDNFGRWQSSFEQPLHHCLETGVRGRPFVEQLTPDELDYFVLKPKHSGF